MTQLRHPVEPFGEVNVYRQPGGALQIVATVLMEPDIEGARCGLALDGSSSMRTMYGATQALSPLFRGHAVNVVEPVARAMAGYLARFSSSGKTSLIYWACGPDGSGLEEIGEVDEKQAQTLAVPGPRRLSWGRSTRLLPPVRHFIEQSFRTAPWAICVFVTDGIIEDLQEVRKYSYAFAHQIASGQRSFIKLVVIGVGEAVDARQLAELDDMFQGSGLVDRKGNAIDLWDHKLASEMRQLEEIFAEVVSEDVIVADRGRVVDARGRLVKDYSDGLPALMRFTLAAGEGSFTLELPGGRVTQDLSEAFARA
jgi:hypothetical protein